MKVSYNWLKKFVEFDLSPGDLSSMLTSIGVETSIASGGCSWTDVITAKVLTKEKHPGADKLSLCALTDGVNNYSVVCGAENVDAGQIVPLAKIGAILPGNFQIKKTKIRGVDSEGMICSEQELGFKENSEGILVLDENTKVGVPLESVLDSDSVLNIEITTNRGDCLSHLGVAREIGAKLKKTPILPVIKTFDVPELSVVKVESDLCSRYIGAVISGVKVGPSPKWMSDALEKCGIRSINNIVDITNYVMLELGHPLHAFDISKLVSKKIVVRTAQENESMTALDGKIYKLDSEMLVIADETKPVAIAGVMGGEYSGIDEKTETIFLESAIFKPSSIRKTSKKLNLSSDSSYRFERGSAWDIAELASWRAVNLISELAGGRIEIREDVKTVKYEKTNITLRVPRVSKLLGYTIEENKIAEILRFLGIDLKPGGKEIILCSIPSWRNDIKEEIDLIEEVARIYGYDNIPKPSEQGVQISTKSNSFFPGIIAGFRSKLSGLGFSEALNYSFSEIKELEFFGLKYFYKIANPISKENEVLRPSLLPSLYRNIMLNVSQGAESAALFEYGKIYVEQGERKTFAAIMCGRVWPEWWKWAENKISPKYDFYFGGGIVKNIIPSDNFIIAENLSPKNYFHPGKTAAIVHRGKAIGQFGVLKPSLNGDLKDDIFYFEIDIESLENVYDGEVSLYEHYSKFPLVKRDISVTAEKSLQFAKIEKVIKSVMKTGNILKDYSLFSVYEDESKLGAGKISYSFRLSYRNNERTLTDEEVNADMNALIQKLDSELYVKLRT